jgi:hypothetical protein
MYIVENRVFYTSAKFELDEKIVLSNLEIFGNIIKDVKISFSPYWFNRFLDENQYIKFSINRENKDFFIDNFNKNKNVEHLIEEIVIKTHPNGITSSEVFFKLDKNENIDFFDDYLDEFSKEYSDSLFNLVYKFNQTLEKLKLLNFSKLYKYGVLIKENNIDLFKDSYLLRVHLFTQNDDKYFEIKSNYQINNIKSLESSTKILENKFKATLYWAFALWETNELKLDVMSNLLDIDTYTMNEIVIYNVAGENYNELMFSIDFNSDSNLKANVLFEMYKINAYFLQKNKFNELSFNENVNNFVTSQREIEKFKMQEENYTNSEKKFLDVYNTVESNEKSNANRIIQYILTALTLLTIISVSKDIIEFIKAEFMNEQIALKVGIFSRSEFLSVLLIAIIFLFLKLRQYIKKI